MLLLALALPDSGFLVTPVLAWSAQPTYTGSVNLAEVSIAQEVAVRDLHARRRTAAALAAHTPAYIRAISTSQPSAS